MIHYLKQFIIAGNVLLLLHTENIIYWFCVACENEDLSDVCVSVDFYVRLSFNLLIYLSGTTNKITSEQC